MEPFVKKQYDEYQANRTEKTILSKDELCVTSYFEFILTVSIRYLIVVLYI